MYRMGNIYISIVAKPVSLPCSSGSTIFDIMALMIGVGIPPRQATKGTNGITNDRVRISPYKINILTRRLMKRIKIMIKLARNGSEPSCSTETRFDRQ